MSKSKALFGVLVLFVVVGAIFLLQKGEVVLSPRDAAQSLQSIKIGAIYPLTGPAASFGQAFRRGAELAVQLRSTKDAPVSIQFEDSKTDPKAGLAAYRKLRTEHIDLFLTTISSIALAIEPVARQDKVLLFADVAYPGITGKNPLLFRHSSTTEQEGGIIFRQIISDDSISSVGVMWINDDFGLAFNKEFMRLNKASTPRSLNIRSVSYAKADSDLKSETAKVLSAQPDVIVITGYGKAMGLAIKRVRESGFQGDIYATMGLTLTPDAAAAAGSAANGIYYTQLKINDDERFVEFSSQYQARYGERPPTYAVLSFNSASLLIDAARASGGLPEKTAMNILGRTSYIGAGEVMTITSTGDIQPPVVLRQFHQVQE